MVKNFTFVSKDLIKKCPKLTYTAMHGVGYPFIIRSMAAFGFPAVIPVEEQVQPDPEFRTVAYPNPEEGEGALKLAIQTAEANGSTFILANDPDADRLAIAEKLPSGDWKIFKGDQIGAIFAKFLLETYKEKKMDVSKIAMVNSTVSSKMIQKMAEVEGFRFEEVLTGFKWIANKAIELDA